MTAALFLGFLAIMAGMVVWLVARYVGGQASLQVAAGLGLWFGYAGVLGYFGVLKNSTRPPGIVFLVVPVALFLIVFVLFVARSNAAARIATAFPLWILLALQCFRVGVELFLHQLWKIGLIPKMLTFDGANVDIWIGASAPLAAWLSTRGKIGTQLAQAWNVLGLCALANVVTRAVLTAPGPLNLLDAEVPNRMMGTFPFLFIPGFFVPLAFVLHAFALRNIASRTPHSSISSLRQL
jgi:hypothetical protein